jgi:hypothetical protein
MLFVTYSWLTTIRLIHLTIVSPNQCSKLGSFVFKILWMVFPIVPCPSNYQQQWPVHYDLISAGFKLLLNHWIYRWLLKCPGSDSYARLIMFYIFVLSYTFMSDAQSAIVRIVTRDKYMLKSLTNFPLLSQSIREFWGRRYNQLVGTILRESVFQPVVQYISSKTAASLITFLVSGLLHVHLALVAFKDVQPAISNIAFFLLHGIACAIEANIGFQLPTPLAWLLTQSFLLATASLQIGPFTRIGPEFYAINPSILYDQKWVPKLPVPNYCPK